MKRWLAMSLGCALVCAAAALPLTASATLPKPKTALIKPFKSIGPIKLGISKQAAVGKWGTPDGCAKEDAGQSTCSWAATGATDFPEESASLQISGGGDVCGILIRAGTTAATGKLSITKLKKWKTKEGVRVGSSLKAAKKVLGKLVVKKHGVTTAFMAGFTAQSNDQVADITIFKDKCNVT